MLVALAVAASACAVAAVAAALTFRSRWRAALAGSAEELAAAQRALEAETTTTERLSLALDAVVEGVVVLDEEGRVVLRNPTAAAYRDPRHGDAIVAKALEELVALAAGGTAEVRSLELFGPPARVVVVRAVPLAGEGRRSGVLATIEDVTERRRLEAVRRDFVANMSHELRTPVGAISLLAETLADEDDPAVARRLAARVVDEADRVSRTIEDLLVLTRIETGDGPVREDVAIDRVLAEATERIRPAADQRGIEVRVQDAHPDVVVQADRRQLVSALYNLLDNAVTYSEEGSSVQISTEVDEEQVWFSVVDEGIGIPANDLDRIFERFYRVDAARSRHTGGTGLGLAIVRHVAENHHGVVTVASRQGEGSAFTLRIPVRTQE